MRIGSGAIGKAIPSIKKKKKRKEKKKKIIRGKVSEAHKTINFGGILSISG